MRALGKNCPRLKGAHSTARARYGEVRDGEKVMRGLKRDDSPVLRGYQIYHNFFRPHMGLKGKTPAEAAGIKIEGENPWVTVIQNAKKNANREQALNEPDA